MERQLIDGVKVNIGNRDFIIAPLNFKAIRKLRARIAALTGDNEDEKFEAFLDIIHSALLRNYPEMTLEDVEELLDLPTSGQVVSIILQHSGFVPKAPGGASKADPSIGTTSTAASSPQPDGVGSTSTTI